MDYFSAFKANEEVIALGKSGTSINSLSENTLNAAQAWASAPTIGGLKIIADIPALLIVFLITFLVYIGIKETKKATNAMVILKILVVLAVIVVGFFYVTPANWHPFLPNGFSGMMKGVSGVFFAYIGFDAISTTAEECENPQKDLPKGMIYSLVICTVLYILIALVLTGMVNYKELQVSDPLAFVFERVGLNQIGYIISVSAVIATASVLLIFQMGQPRIWMSMSRDGLLPKAFSRIHPKFKTPSFSTIVTGLVVAIPALFMNLTEVTDLTSIGTLFAFVLVCGGVLLLPKQEEVEGNRKRFKMPYINSKYIIPLLLIILGIAFYSEILTLLSFNQGWDIIKEQIPFYLFIILAITMALLSYLKNLSLIPVLGLLSCSYLMTELGYTNWLRFLIWLGIGLIVYFCYGIRKSKLNQEVNYE
jgi:amino acid transporter